MIAWLRRLHRLDLVAASYACAFFAWLILRTEGSPSTVWVGELAFIPLGVAVAWANWRNARAAGIDSRTRLGWRLLALGALLLWGSGTAWSVFLRVWGGDDWPDWIEQLELLQHVAMLGAYLAFPSGRLTSLGRLRYRLDLGMAVAAGLIVSFFFSLRHWLNDPTWDTPAAVAIGAALDWSAFVAVSIGFLQKRDAPVRDSFGLLLLAATTYLLANDVYLVAPTYQPGDAVDGLWFGAWVLRWTAARLAWYRYGGRAGQVVDGRDVGVVRYRGSIYAYFVVTGSFLLLFSQALGGRRQFIGLLAGGTCAMVALLVARQIAEIRENRRLFAAQLAQEARFRSLVQNASDVVMVVDERGRLTYVSPSAVRVFGEHTSVVEGARLADLVPAEDLSIIEPLLRPDAARSRPVQCRMPASAGAWREVEILTTDLRDDPSVGGVVVNCRDITERKELERQLQHAQRLDLVGHLAGGLAHDLNNVLTVIRGYAELLRTEIPAGTPASTDLGHIEQAVDRAAAVTRKVLAFSRKQVVQRTVVDLNTVLRDLQPILRQLLTSRIEVQVEHDPGLWPVLADQGQIEQVVINLTTNARDAMPEGGTLQILTANRVLNGTEGRNRLPPGDYAALIVTDRGVGMSAAVVDRIFEPFFSTKPKERGMGLGLAMVKAIIEESDGRVTVESAPGRGATFTILLPRCRVAAQAAANAEDAPKLPSDVNTVLLVDDEFGVRTIARRILERDGYRVLEASGGAEALDVAASADSDIDVLLTDLVMPGMHGRELVARFQRQHPGVPVICMTGFAGDAESARDQVDGVVALVTKPFSFDVLRRAVSAACAHRLAQG